MTKKLVPLKQGDLDGLCSIYATLNSIRYIIGESFMSVANDYDGAVQVFLSLFDENIVNLDVVLNGAEVDVVVNALIYLKKKIGNFDFKVLKRKENIFKLIDKGPVIIGFSGFDNHWTVITHYDDDYFYLFDSSRYTKFAIKDVVFNPKKREDEKICISTADIISVFSAKVA